MIESRAHATLAVQSTASVPERVRAFAGSQPPGKPFTVRELVGLGPRAAVDQALTRLVKSGELERPARGVYVRPRLSAALGRPVPPSPEEVVAAIAQSSGEVLAPHGAEAARRLGLSTQVPMTTVYATSGRSRRVRVGNREVILRHAAPRSLALAGRPAGDALAALRYLGAREVTTDTIRQVERRIGPAETAVLRRSVALMPGWLSELMQRTQEAA
ncbi:MAG: DUF6088 family protein [Micropruina sp.]|uniref:DUF6088 family protein n=1 Tax=Micropruina sp. TaxID=2737536 RepID=UPI0039E68E6A